MAEYLTSIKMYAYLSGAWVDITSDVQTSDNISAIWGMADHRPDTRIASTGTLKFSLDNATTKYSPNSSSLLTGWKLGVPVRLDLVYDGITRTRFRGYVDDIQPDAGIKGPRRAHVTCVDWMEYAAKHPLFSPPFLQNSTGDAGVNSLLALMPIQPQAKALDVGVSTFLTIFDTVKAKTVAYSELSKITLSEMGYTYIAKDPTYGETLVFENNYHRNGLVALTNIPINKANSDILALETGDLLVFEDGSGFLLDEVETFSSVNSMSEMKDVYGKNIINRVTATAYPKLIDTTLHVLYSLPNPQKIASGQVIKMRVTYRDPTGGAKVNSVPSSMIAPTITTDYLMNTKSDGTGSNITSDLTVAASYDTAGVSYTLTNANVKTGYITLLQARGFGVYAYNPASNAQESSTSYNQYGYTDLTLDQVYQQDLNVGILEAGKILERDKTPRTTVDHVTMFANRSGTFMMAFLTLDVGDLVSIQEDQTGINGWYYIQGMDFTILPGGVIMFGWILRQTFCLLTGLTLLGVNIPANGYVDYGVLPEFSAHQKTYSAWIYYKSVSSSEAIFGTYNSTGAGAELITDFTTPGKLVFWAGWSSTTGEWTTTNDVLTALANTWVHVALTYDDTVTTAPILYINGVSVPFTVTAGPVGSYLDDSNNIFTLGNNYYASGNAYLFAFLGTIRDFRFYNRILSQADVTSLMNAGAGGTNMPTGLLFQGPAARTVDLQSTYENQALGTDNKVLDNILGVVGTPQLSPTGLPLYANTTTGGAAITLIGTAGAVTNGGSTISFTHALTGGTDTIEVVLIAERDGDSVSSITHGARHLAQFASYTQGGGASKSKVEIWYLVAPEDTKNSDTVLITFTGAVQAEAQSLYLNNVLQYDPFGVPVTANGTGTAITVTAASATGQFVIDVVSAHSTLSATAGQTSIFNSSADGTWHGASSSKPGAASVVMGWTAGASVNWIQAAVALKQSP